MEIKEYQGYDPKETEKKKKADENSGNKEKAGTKKESVKDKIKKD